MDVSTSAPASAPVSDASAPAEGAAPGVPTEVKAEAPLGQLTNKLKLKVDNEEIEESLPFEIDSSNAAQVEWLQRHLQMSKAASKRIEEAVVSKREAQQLIRALQEDPESVLRNPKIMGEEKFREIAERYLTKELERQMMTPEQRKAHENEERLRKYEQDEQSRTKQVEGERAKQLETHYAQEFQKTIIDALAASGLPKSPHNVKRMAAVMQKNLEHGLNLDAKHLASIVRDERMSEIVSILSEADPAQLLALLGEDVTNKIRKADLAKLKAAQLTPSASSRSGGASSPQKKSIPQVTSSEWGEWIRKQNGL